ncbi:MAG: polyprenyl synthetase family protein [SAR86 cluster bacterium]|uniref:Polyprenyl synthetase family protein n=1 Tax=SAR86 cluster bacterium TaxID=2030880 RepID=A0A520MSU2_9GAMM|nr:MAG: polyprenyl synthetase family protein [SAR86 cluster bacterium]
MHLLTKTTQTELNRVQATIEKELSNEKIIQEIYEYIFNVKGKKTRALLCLLASKSSDIKAKNRIALASIIELLHTATLVHDDVVDESERRRGTESVNQVWTNSYSVLMGDFIYSKAFILMVKLGISSILDELAKATNDIARGEIIQLELFENKQPITLDDLLKVSYLKTGRLFEASAKTGAMLACKSKEEIKIFGQLGKALGTAFQIQDDILDYEAFKLDIGKPAFKDFREGKITFPLYFALQNIDKKNRRFLLDRLGQSKLLKKDQNIIYQLIRDDKTQKEINALLDKYAKETLKHLNKLKHHPCYNEMLNLINFSYLRKI